MDYHYLGKQIRTYRRACGMSQSALAQNVGLSAAHIGHIERGTRRASLETVVAISQQLHVSLDVLIFEEAQPTASEEQRMKWHELQKMLAELRRKVNELVRLENAGG